MKVFLMNIKYLALAVATLSAVGCVSRDITDLDQWVQEKTLDLVGG